jgi:hypothetical protein
VTPAAQCQQESLPSFVLGTTPFLIPGGQTLGIQTGINDQQENRKTVKKRL